MSNQQDILLSEKKTGSIKSLLNSDKMKEQFKNALPSICTPERFLRVAITAITKNPKLAECTETSLMSCLLDCAQLGIEPDGRRAHLIPFYSNKKKQMECQLIIDFKGLVELVRRSGEVSNIIADVVKDNDEFEVSKKKVTKHTYSFKKPRGNPYAYWACAVMKDGSEQYEVMTKEDVEAIRKRSKSADNGPWVTDFDEMAKKTVFKRLTKWLTLSPENMAKLDEIEKKEFDIDMPLEVPRAEFKSIEQVKNDVD